jgi:hypothetical protein
LRIESYSAKSNGTTSTSFRGGDLGVNPSKQFCHSQALAIEFGALLCDPKRARTRAAWFYSRMSLAE